MSFQKAQFDVKGSELQFGMPFTKVDEARREVSGFATLDNVDSQDDIVTAEASKDAFARCRGNIREMHQPSAIGVLKNFEEKVFYGADGTPHTGIYVTVHVSKGAEDAWQKVLDGTYSGFSIGGNITDSSTEWVKDKGSNVRFVKSYDLIELSLVDNPANQLSNIFSIHKASDGGTLIKGMVADTQEERVFWCDTDHDGISEVNASTKSECPMCKNEMSVVGRIDSSISQPVNEQVGEIVSKYLGSKGGVEKIMPDEIKSETEEVAVETDETEQPNPVEEEAEVVEETPEESAPVESEVVTAEEVDETPENDIEKVINDLKDAIHKSATDSREIAEEASRKFEEKVAELEKSFTVQKEEIENKFSDLSKKLDDVSSENAEVRKSLEVLNSSTAFKKSGEVDSPTEKSPKVGTFGGLFIASTDDL